MVKSGMSEYISKEYIRNIVLKRWSDACGAESYAYSRVLDDIAEAPIENVALIMHGKWKYDSYNMNFYCTACNEEALVIRHTTIDGDEYAEECLSDYCPNCGARMDKQ
jgi:hypothetical protein